MPTPPHRDTAAGAGERGAVAPLSLSTRDFARLAAFIQGECGIRMPPVKKGLLESRLARHVRTLGFAGFGEYCDHVLGGGNAEELVRMVDSVTTNKTDFFREPQHFDLLTARVLPALAGEGRGTARRELRLWSAGCSTGEEPYTAAMVLAEHAARTPGFQFTIHATDLSTRALARAARAEYREAQVAPVPLPLRRRWLLRSAADPDVVRVSGRLRASVRFSRLNLLAREYGLPWPVDVVFCRNVFIYFERATQAEILRRFARALAPGGFLFLGHSESITGMDVPFEPVAPTVYRVVGALP